jgi:hypothetical protein
MILDGGVDPTRFGVQGVQDELAAKERALNAFLTECNQTSRCGLRLTGKSARTRYEEMLLIASQTGIGAEKINRDDLEGIVGTFLGEDWGILQAVLGELSRGGTATSVAILNYFGNDSSARYEDGGFEAISCRDGEFPSGRPEEGITPEQRLTIFRAAAPHFLAFADYWANDAMCLGWPVAPRPKVALSTTAGNRIVVVGNLLDVRTPLEWSRGIAFQLSARLVTVDDYVHTATLSGEKCITDMTTAWLVDLVPPAAGLGC